MPKTIWNIRGSRKGSTETAMRKALPPKMESEKVLSRVDSRSTKEVAGGEDGEQAAGEAEDEDGGGQLPVHALGAELLHGVDSAAGGDAGEEEGEPVEGMLVVSADVLDPEQSEGERDEAKGEVDEEDPVPAGVGGDEAAQRGAEDEGGQPGPGDVGDGLGELLLGGVAQDDEAADWNHHGTAEALEDAHQGELGEGVGDAAEQG
jgi:hypothetical protein